MIKPNHNDQTIHTPPDKCWLIHNEYEGVYVTIGNPAFCLFLYLTGIHFRGTLQHGSDVRQHKIKCRPIRTQETGGVSLSDVLYGCYFLCMCVGLDKFDRT